MNGGSRRPALDVLRAVAALGVVFGHAGMLANAAHAAPPGVLGFVAQNGWKGIYLFFAISGYLIARPFVRAALGVGPRVELRAYALRRAARIVPAHWIALTAMLVLITLDAAAIPQDATPGRYIAHMLLVQNFVPGISRAILPVTWTLGLEAVFYVTVPVAFALATNGGQRTFSQRQLLAGVGVVTAASVAVFLAGDALPLSNALLPIVGYLVFFAPGIALSALEVGGTASRLMRWATASPATLVALALALWVTAGEINNTPVQTLLDALFGGVAVLAAITGLQRIRFPRAVVAVGEASYGIYLWHWLVANALLWITAAAHLPVAMWQNQALDWLAIAVLTFPVAWLSWVAVERPAMRWARRCPSSARRRSATPTRRTTTPRRAREAATATSRQAGGPLR